MDHTTQIISAALTVMGVDIGKDVFHLVGFDHQGKVAFRRKIKLLALVKTFKGLLPCIVGMEACLSAHFVARSLRKLGHEPRIIPASIRVRSRRGRRTTTATLRRSPKRL
jgi:transposase